MESSIGQEQMRIGILGGTFDPIHLGHLVAATEALHGFALDRVVLMPAGRPWQKAKFSDPEDRLLMTTMAAATHPKLTVSRIEIDRRGPTYTVDTLEAFHRFFPGSTFFLIVGADVALEMDTWHRVEDVASLADVVAVTRPGSELTSMTTQAGLPDVHVMEMPALPISSTDIRRRIAEGKPIDYLVPAAVARFIRERGLYVEATEEARGA